MNLFEIVNRESDPVPWSEGDNIPWHETGFSARMLKEHLSQEHDAASRRFEIIDEHVTWIHNQVLSGQPARILDLGCGPGLYANRLAKLEHTCLGIDYSPASIDYARHEASRAELDCLYIQDDLRNAQYGTGYELVMLISGEFNVFCPGDASLILEKANYALQDGGLFLLEPHKFEAIRQRGLAPPTWYTAESGLFAEGAHICFRESFWRAEDATATIRYYVQDVITCEFERYAQSMQAYTDDQYRQFLHQHGFGELKFFPSLGDRANESSPEFFAILARKSKS
jgi:SAM-dependent methyltransferase